jgi:hypothetical protein
LRKKKKKSIPRAAEKKIKKNIFLSPAAQNGAENSADQLPADSRADAGSGAANHGG